MKPAAYLVDLPPTAVPKQSVFLDAAKAVDYAVQHHGSVGPLVRASDADRLRNELEHLAKQWDMQASKCFKDAEAETDQMGRRLIEHGAMCYLNAASDLRTLIEKHKI